jgi:hypothetical protein
MIGKESESGDTLPMRLYEGYGTKKQSIRFWAIDRATLPFSSPLLLCGSIGGAFKLSSEHTINNATHSSLYENRCGVADQTTNMSIRRDDVRIVAQFAVHGACRGWYCIP